MTEVMQIINDNVTPEAFDQLRKDHESKQNPLEGRRGALDLENHHDSSHNQVYFYL